jgi:hypothetical protein
MLINVHVKTSENLHSYFYNAFSGQLTIRVSYMPKIVGREKVQVSYPT